jgi:hypothetical protein
MLSAPNVFVRPREAMKAADEAKAKFTHVDGGCCWGWRWKGCLLRYGQRREVLRRAGPRSPCGCCLALCSAASTL